MNSRKNHASKIKIKKIGVIGLGNMGKGIAKNLLQAKHIVHVWDLNETSRMHFKNKTIISTPFEMSQKCEIIIFVVPGSPEIDAMLKGKLGILSKPRKGLILYDFTTSDPIYTKKLANRSLKKQVVYMDAGMTGGGAKGADEGTMTLMIG